jgi:hypothetical protein
MLNLIGYSKRLFLGIVELVRFLVWEINFRYKNKIIMDYTKVLGNSNELKCIIAFM